MRTRFLCILLTMSQVSAALSGELGTDFNLPGADVFASPPADPSTPDFDSFWDRNGLNTGPLKRPSTPAPAIPRPTAEMLQEAQKKLNFFRRASLKIEYLLSALAFFFPAQRTLIGVAATLYHLFKSDDEAKSRAEVLKLVDTYCKGCGVTQVAQKLLSDQRRVNGIVERGEQNLENMIDVVVPPDLLRLMKYLNSYSVVNNCNSDVTYAVMYLDVDDSWKTSRLNTVNAGATLLERNFVSYNRNYGLLAFKDTRIFIGQKNPGRGFATGYISRHAFGFEQREAQLDELGDWVIKFCE